MLNEKPQVVCLMGPTAAGKTNLAIEMAEKHGYEIVSVDSALIYRGMDIGTAKPDLEMQKRAPHRLIDIKEPTEVYSAADFVSDAKNEIEAILKRGNKPLLVGGTMMYFNALIKGLAKMPQANPEVRKDIEKEAAEFGWSHLHQELERLDPESAKRIHPNDPQRLQRAIEVCRLSGRSMTDLWAEQQQSAGDYQFASIAVMPEERSVLHDRIQQRFDIMMEQGFLAEVEALYARGDLNVDMPSVRCVGYRQIWAYLAGECDLDEAIYRGVVATRQLAKRQVTWLRSWENLQVFDTFDKDLLSKALKSL
ncbi:tRNA (adenosine(37)-N6)-dimethylallyltransferase MiaA [Marinomonas sp. MED121]|uniref:tRNA (adenosine(37)-N6)-dimethylallyltransferase MiaA n=1 Tax=Marinomonas sp. MED121 TaxID=314277 RepID=UPI000566E696|nr:tRNA (adenosine(37)-N6)-dimethylallyltransferase MiaA [Marinomonas sp. MED121]